MESSDRAWFGFMPPVFDVHELTGVQPTSAIVVGQGQPYSRGFSCKYSGHTSRCLAESFCEKLLLSPNLVGEKSHRADQGKHVES